ncbi:hypothetical protein DSM112329_03005 [Paraconexibacter sp. AEG42_29]|uniref:Uncharacterized protein n=2 Tax=Paraconexibacter sp. AEG42_29 TaxID=2997339 RepID=A0AAU7AWS5_9ACTN
MLEGINTNDIIVGAYSDREGGVCPMLAAHRCGGRTSFVSFAKAWDAFAGVKRARRASERELRILRTYLEASLMEEQSAPVSDLGSAIQAHQEIRRERHSREAFVVPALGDAISEHQATARDRRAREAAEDDGNWGFLRSRREDRDTQRALDRVERERELADREQELTPA